MSKTTRLVALSFLNDFNVLLDSAIGYILTTNIYPPDRSLSRLRIQIYTTHYTSKLCPKPHIIDAGLAINFALSAIVRVSTLRHRIRERPVGLKSPRRFQT